MQVSRKELLDDVLDFVGNAADASARNVMERILNRVLTRIWMRQAWSAFKAPGAYVFSTTSGVAEYPLPGDFGRIVSRDGQIRNLTTGRWLKPTDREALEQYDSGLGTTNEQAGQPQWYELPGTQPVTQQPASTGDALEVVSASAADTTVRVEIEGMQVLNGEQEWTQAQVTMTGAGPVALGTWASVAAFGKSYPEGTDPTTELTSSEGIVTLRKTSDQTVLMRLQPHESAREVQIVRLYPKPDQPYQFSIPYMRSLQRVLRDAAPLPEAWDPAVFAGCVNAWKVASGAAPSEPETWPELLDLICFENARASQQTRLRTPYR